MHKCGAAQPVVACPDRESKLVGELTSYRVILGPSKSDVSRRLPRARPIVVLDPPPFQASLATPTSAHAAGPTMDRSWGEHSRCDALVGANNTPQGGTIKKCAGDEVKSFSRGRTS